MGVTVVILAHLALPFLIEAVVMVCVRGVDGYYWGIGGTWG